MKTELNLQNNAWAGLNLNKKNTYHGEFTLIYRNRERKATALFETLELLNKLFREKQGNPQPEPRTNGNSKSTAWTRIRKSEIGRWIGLNLAHKTVSSVGSGCVNMFCCPVRAVRNCLACNWWSTATDVIPWTPGSKRSRDYLDLWCDGVGADEIDSDEYEKSTSVVSEADENITATGGHTSTSSGPSQEQTGGTSGPITHQGGAHTTSSSSGKKRRKRTQGGRSSGESKPIAQTGTATRTKPQQKESDAEQSAWDKLDDAWKLLIIGGCILVLILCVVGLYCCLKSDKKVAMQPRGYPEADLYSVQHDQYDRPHRRSRSHVSRTPGYHGKA